MTNSSEIDLFAEMIRLANNDKKAKKQDKQPEEKQYNRPLFMNPVYRAKKHDLLWLTS